MDLTKLIDLLDEKKTLENKIRAAVCNIIYEISCELYGQISVYEHNRIINNNSYDKKITILKYDIAALERIKRIFNIDVPQHENGEFCFMVGHDVIVKNHTTTHIDISYNDDLFIEIRVNHFMRENEIPEISMNICYYSETIKKFTEIKSEFFIYMLNDGLEFPNENIRDIFLRNTSNIKQ